MIESASNNVVEMLVQAAARSADHEALVVETHSRSVSVTFGELWERVDRVSCGLRSLGLAAGDRAVIMVPMSIDLYVLLLAVLKLGASAIFVDPWMGFRQVANIAAFAEPRAYIGVAKSHLYRLFDRTLQRVPISVTTGRAIAGVPARYTLEQLYRDRGDGVVSTVDGESPALITFTSGSSGQPKGANRTHGYLLAQHFALQAEFPYEDADIDCTNFPVFALNNLARGITTIVPKIDFTRVASVDGCGFARQLALRDVTTITASPPLIDALCLAIATDGRRLPNLRRVLSGGAPIRDSQLRRWRECLPNAEILVIYGSTEAEPVAHIGAMERLHARSSVSAEAPGFCTGRPISRVEAKVIRIHRGPIELNGGDWSEWELPAGDIGELIVCGEHVGKSYFRNAEATAENKIRDSRGATWHRMGDTGYFDHYGRFWLAGRVHSTIHRAGTALHPQLIEQAAGGDDARIVRAAAVGCSDEVLGQRVALVLQAINPDKATAAGAAERVRQAGFPIDEVFITTDALPVDPRHNSKCDYDRIRRGLESRRRMPRGMIRWQLAELQTMNHTEPRT